MIRTLQQRKELPDMDFKDLPSEIPQALSIGTKVTGRLNFVYTVYIQKCKFENSNIKQGGHLNESSDK
jgi:hypothetical protein